jgi:hypothetical protein
VEFLIGAYFVAVSSVMPLPSTAVSKPLPLAPKLEETLQAPDLAGERVPDLPEKPALFQQVIAIPVPPEIRGPDVETKCHPGRVVMIPDGREGTVTSWDGKVCRVLAYGEAYVSLFNEDMIEPVYPQQLIRHNFGH